MQNHIFNIPASCSFADTLATRFLKDIENNPQSLSSCLFLLPNRRSALSLRDAFVRLFGTKPAILPKMIPIADIDEDEVLFGGADNADVLKNLPPAISSTERLFLLAKLINARPTQYGLPEMSYAQALALSEELCKLMDNVYNQQLSFDKLQDIVPAQYAVHWQETLRFLKIITHWWPEILAQRGVCDVAQRRNALLDAQADVWARHFPKHKVIAAGIEACFPGLVRILKVIAQMPQGEIYFYGLDRFLDENSWQMIDENHPQYQHKLILEALNIQRADVADVVQAQNLPREQFVAEIMRPAADTLRWQELAGKELPSEAVKNLHCINCFDSRQEALSIALLLRETLNTPEKTAALVTTDRQLARRVCAEMRRWNIEVDDSAGKPLHLCPIGIYLCLIPNLIETDFSAKAILALVKNPFVRLQTHRVELLQQIRLWEYQERKPVFDISQKNALPEPLWLKTLKENYAPFAALFKEKTADFKTLLTAHLKLAESLAADMEKSGAQNLWRGDDGRMAAQWLSEILEKAHEIGAIETSQYAFVLTALLSTQTVRPIYGTHPRLKILGPIEARFNQFDRVIIGGLNEGVWPMLPSSDGWLSRPMKKEFGLMMPETAIGAAAADFARLLSAPEVYLTRAERCGGTPANKSRWWLRLETVLEAYGLPKDALSENVYYPLALALDNPIKTETPKRPMPKPSIQHRPKELSASAVEVLMRDPYEIYARYILKLYPLEDIDSSLSMREYGSVVHKVLERFNRAYPEKLPENAEDIMLSMGLKLFDEMGVEPESKAFWLPRFEKTVRFIAHHEKIYRQNIVKVVPEVAGSFSFDTKNGKFTIKARADRLDLTTEGKINIIDYKTGKIRTKAEVFKGYAPQLPIEGLIVREGGFQTNEFSFQTTDVGRLIYWQLGEKTSEIDADEKNLLNDTLTRLKMLIEPFADFDTPYPARPNPKHLLEYADYEHLARVQEWASGGDDE